jgi:16S rRNA processing protein RimM
MSGPEDPMSVFAPGSDAAFGRSEPQFLVVGRVSRPHGLRGELRVEIHTDYPERFAVYKQLYVGPSFVPYKIKKHRFHHGRVLLTLEGVDDRTKAEALQGQWVWIAIEDAIPLQEGEYYLHQVLGLQVTTVEGEALGRVTEVIETKANDVYVVQGTQGEVLLPAIPQVIVKVDVQAGQMTVRLLDGLRPPPRPALSEAKGLREGGASAPGGGGAGV